ncbi:hypothetical protein Tco_0529144 [Tanacetum coccineum]
MESLNSNSQERERELHLLQQMQDKAKERCMVSLRLLHSHLTALSNNDLKGTSIEGGFEREFAILFEQDESIQERAKHKREYDKRMNDRMMQSKKGNANSSKALDAGLVVTESNETESERHVLSSRSRKDTHVEDADINFMNDKQPMVEEKVFANVALKNELRKLKGNSMDTKFAKPSILGKPVLQPPRNQSVVRQPNALKSERPNFLKPRFASQVDVNNDLLKPVTPHYLPKVRESVLEKPRHVIAHGSSRNSSKESYGLNDMAHNYYLEEAKKKTQDKNKNLKPRKNAFC